MKLEMEKWQSGEDVVRAITLDDAADFYEIVKQPPLYAALWWQAESVEACAFVLSAETAAPDDGDRTK